MRKIAMGATVLAAAALATLGVVSVASAAATPRTASQLVRPAAVAGDKPVYTANQVKGAWTAVRGSFTAELPAGYALPADMSKKFVAEDDKHTFYVEPAALDMEAASYWRCAQLDAAFSDGETVSDTDLTKLFAVYAKLPSVAAYDQTGYSTATLKRAAPELKVADAAHALYALDCQGFQK